MSINPVEIPTGAVRYNTDSNKMEVYIGSTWMEVAVSTPNLDGGARGVFFFGFDDTNNPKVVDFITIPTQGNAIDFGDMTGNATFYGGAFSSNTRGVYFGGAPGGGRNEIQFITFSSTGDSQDFGDLTAIVQYNPVGVSNQTRGIRCGGSTAPTGSFNVLDFVTIATEGNAVDFGDMVRKRRFATSNNSSTRGFVTAGDDGGTKFSDTEFITIHTTGNSITFGELSSTGQNANNGVVCSPTRGLISGGSFPSVTKTIKKFEMSSLGEATDFGDLSAIRAYMGGCSNPVRGVFGGGYYPSPAAYLNIIEYTNISTGGDVVDFGDRTIQGSYLSGASNAHGGL